MSVRIHCAAAGLISLAVVAPAAAQQRLGNEFQVNTYTTQSQARPAVASDPEGNFLVVWDDSTFATPGGILGQRFDAAGNAIGGELEVSPPGTLRKLGASVTADPQGNFVVVWAAIGVGVFGQRLEGSGNPLGAEFQVSTLAGSADVAAAVDGSFVVVWNETEIFGRRFDASGSPLGEKFQVNTYTPNVQRLPAVAVDGAGEFVVVWDGGYFYRNGEGYFDVSAQRYDSAGNRIGGEFQVNTKDLYEAVPDVAMDEQGGFVVAWESGFTYPEKRVDIVGQRYDSAGNRVGGEFQLSTSSLVNAYPRPQVAPMEDDGFVVAWENAYGNSDILGRRFDALGQPIGAEFLVNSYTTGQQTQPAVASNTAGDFVVVWEDGEQLGSNAPDIFGQGFAGPGLQLVADGTCPGMVDVSVSNAPPSSEVGVIAAANTNGFTKGGTLCAGTEFELGEPFELPPTWVIVDGEGNGAATLELPANRCWIEALALADCETSRAVLVPATPAD